MLKYGKCLGVGLNSSQNKKYQRKSSRDQNKMMLYRGFALSFVHGLSREKEKRKMKEKKEVFSSSLAKEDDD